MVVETKVVAGSDVRQALTFVERGEAEAQRDAERELAEAHGDGEGGEEDTEGGGDAEIRNLKSAEWQGGHVPGAMHVFLPDLPQSLSRLPKDRPVAVYCDSGYRASIAASILRAQGFDARNVPGSWQAWQACGLPVEGAPDA